MGLDRQNPKQTELLLRKISGVAQHRFSLFESDFSDALHRRRFARANTQFLSSSALSRSGASTSCRAATQGAAKSEKHEEISTASSGALAPRHFFAAQVRSRKKDQTTLCRAHADRGNLS